jgi:5,10-methylenetetrahydromethanopterin reductase
MMPGGQEWLAAVAHLRPEHEWHLAVHEGHVVALTERDRAVMVAAGEAILTSGWTGTAGAVAGRFDAAGAAGITEVVYAPAGPEIETEIRRFGEAAGASAS